jgi:RHO1 GDP-GTP exchange protein 1/2
MTANRPAGPRGPPDKRNAAYQDIFARPGAVHRSLAPHHQPYRQPYPMTTSGAIQAQPYPLQQPSFGPLPTSHSRSTSIASSVYSFASPRAHPEKPPDEPVTRTGLTPAQAYQRQVYLNDPQAFQRLRLESSPSPTPIVPVSNGAQSHPRVEAMPKAIPKTTSDSDNPGLDLAAESSRSSLDSDGHSELPWARPRTPSNCIWSYPPIHFLSRTP